jgi:hypothetical protein
MAEYGAMGGRAKSAKKKAAFEKVKTTLRRRRVSQQLRWARWRDEQNRPARPNDMLLLQQKPKEQKLAATPSEPPLELPPKPSIEQPATATERKLRDKRVERATSALGRALKLR